MKIKYEKSNQYFVNPYNFVPTNIEKCESDNTKNDNSENELLTGYLKCSLKCITPLVIPDTENKYIIESLGNDKFHYGYPFLGMNQSEKSPRIPGSSIRGVIRNVYETITDSCFVTMKKDTMVSRRDRLTEKGILLYEDNQWNLYSAERFLLVTNKEKCKGGAGDFSFTNWEKEYGNDYYGKKVAFSFVIRNGKKYVKELSIKPRQGLKEGYLCIGEKTSSRQYQSIFQPKEKEERTITDKDMDRLDYVVKMYRNESINRNLNNEKQRHYGYKGYELAKRNGAIPIYYKNENGKLYMSLASMGRITYHKTLEEIEGVKRCEGVRNELCPACTIFGSAEGEKNGSRIRFIDGKCNNFSEEEVRFDELSSPRISYIPFYLEQKNKSSRYDVDYESGNVKIRGRKYYWHHQPKIEGNEWIECTERNATFHVLRNATFEFRVYFDGITREQLQLLSTSLHLGENKLEGELCHKMGHGKPLGYGSVKIKIDKCILRKYDENGWKLEEDAVYEDEKYSCNQDCWNALIEISRSNAISNDPVEYPKIIVNADEAGFLKEIEKTNEYASHKWFYQNYNFNNKRRKAHPEQSLRGIVNNEHLQHYEIHKIIVDGEITNCADGKFEVKCKEGIKGFLDVTDATESVLQYLKNNLDIGMTIQVYLVKYSEDEISFAIDDLDLLKPKRKHVLKINNREETVYLKNGLPVSVKNIKDIEKIKNNEKINVEVIGIEKGDLILQRIK